MFKSRKFNGFFLKKFILVGSNCKIRSSSVRWDLVDFKEHPEYPKFGPYRKRNKFLKILNDSVWDLPAPVNLNA